jgi:hypothetical protein
VSRELPPLPGEICTCGRDAVTAFENARGRVGYCGVPGSNPINPCDCAASQLTPHDVRACRYEVDR